MKYLNIPNTQKKHTLSLILTTCIKKAKSKALYLINIAIILLFTYPISQIDAITNKQDITTQKSIQESIQKAKKILIDPKLKNIISNNKYIVLIDFNKPSNEERLFLYNIYTNKITFKALVSHGRGSGKGAITEKFSNIPGTGASSEGAFVTTGSNFKTKFNKVIHVEGLEKGINNNANKRSIEFHDAWYVSKDFAKKYNKIGNSTGCFAMNIDDIKFLIPLVDKGALVYAFK